MGGERIGVGGPEAAPTPIVENEQPVPTVEGQPLISLNEAIEGPDPVASSQPASENAPLPDRPATAMLGSQLENAPSGELPSRTLAEVIRSEPANFEAVLDAQTLLESVFDSSAQK